MLLPLLRSTSKFILPAFEKYKDCTKPANINLAMLNVLDTVTSADEVTNTTSTYHMFGKQKQ